MKKWILCLLYFLEDVLKKVVAALDRVLLGVVAVWIFFITAVCVLAVYLSERNTIK